jgi:hypothetical protein
MHMIKPMPHWNGSKADDLAAQMQSVAIAIEDAATLMRQWQPHGRDYQGTGDYLSDRREFERRHRLLTELAEQYSLEARRCMDLHYGREPREVTT